MVLEQLQWQNGPPLTVSTDGLWSWWCPARVSVLLSLLCPGRQRYIMTSREVKRWDATSRSPVYASLSTTLKVCTCVGSVACVSTT